MFILILGVILLVIIAIWKLAIKSQTPKRYPVNKVPDVPYKNITFYSGESLLKGWFIPAKVGKTLKSPLMIFVHGWGSNRSRMLRYINPLYEAGYSMLLFDVRSHGESDGVKAPTVKTFHDDVMAAIQFAKTELDVDSNRIGILAHSFGGFGSIVANKKDLGIKVIVADSIPVQFSTIMKAALKRYKLPYFPLGPLLSKIMFFRAGITRKDLQNFDVLRALSERKSPVLLIHSKNDDFVPSSELDYIVNQIEVPHLYVQSKGHRSSETDSKFWENVIPFLKENIR